jgi:secondary thiamine-phosphate synthase enzyme
MSKVMEPHTRSCSLEATDYQRPHETQVVVAGECVFASETITVTTLDAPHFIDITDVVQATIDRVGITIGSALVFSKHTTAAIVANEHEPLLLEDITDLLTRLAPPAAGYRHDDMRIRTVNLTPDEPENGHAHCQHLFLGPSIHLPINAGKLDLGRWQRIFLVELDRPRQRQIVVQLNGARVR